MKWNAGKIEEDSTEILVWSTSAVIKYFLSLTKFGILMVKFTWNVFNKNIRNLQEFSIT